MNDTNHLAVAAAPPPARVVVLGASNLARDPVGILSAAAASAGAPLEVLAAWGRGRSYGQTSSFFGRRLPGILQSGLWDVLRRLPVEPVRALVTDVGNDLVYGVPPAIVAGWIETVLRRLHAAGARTSLTALPLESIARLSPARYALLRWAFFPGSGLGWEEARRRARELDERLVEIADRWGAVRVPLQSHWYGWDPIHLRRTGRGEAFGALVADWRVPRAAPGAQARWTWRDQWRIYRATPAEWQWMGGKLKRRQPSAELGDGTRIYLY